MTAAPACTLRLTMDAEAVLAELQLLVETAGRLPKLCQALLDLGDLSADFSWVQRDVATAPGAGEVCLVLQLPQRLRDLAAATRAGKFDGV
jgi:hypothetical protein